jgi:hydroxysqualene synthase
MSIPADLANAYAVCAKQARMHYENFPVASRLLPRRMWPQVAAVYAFARVADDFADEGDLPVEERQCRLDAWAVRLHACVRPGRVPAEPRVATADSDVTHQAIFAALGHTIRSFDLPVDLFEDLLSAFRQDVTVRRYATWADVLDYCRRSANPVGRIVLRIAGYRDPALERASDALCTALQLTNFWQDLARDWRGGRLYVPGEDQTACGAREEELNSGRLNPPWTCALERVAQRTRELYVESRPVCDGVTGRLRYELRLTWLGGVEILRRVERARFDVFTGRPRLSMGDLPWLLCQATLGWRRPTSFL